MKRILSIVFSLFLLSLCFCLPAFAAGEGTLSLSGASVAPGESVTLSLSIAENPGIGGLGIRVSFDTSVLEMTGATASTEVGMIQVNPNYGNGYQMNWLDIDGNHYQGVAASFTFMAKEAALPGSTTVRVEVTSAYDYGNPPASVSFNSPSATVTVNCPGHRYGAAYENAGDQHKKVCSLCGDTVLENHTAGDWTVLTPAGCINLGKEKSTCTLCQGEMQRDLAPLGHSFGDWQSKVPAGCTTPGKDERSCGRCSAKEERDSASLGHSFSDAVVTKPATCKEAGVETGTCSRCNEKTENPLPLLAHDYAPWEADQAATCTKAGTQKRECRSCGHKLTRNVAATGHDFEDPKLVKEATLYEEGLIEGKCKKCDETTQQILPCTAKDVGSGVEINAKTGAFEEGTSFRVSQEVEESLREALNAQGSEFLAYTIIFDREGEEVLPSESFTVLFPAPEFEEVEVYRVTEHGELIPVEYSVMEDGTLVVETSLSGMFALVNADSEPLLPPHPQVPEVSDAGEDTAVPSQSSEQMATAENDRSGSVIGIILILVFILAALGASYWYFFIKR